MNLLKAVTPIYLALLLTSCSLTGLALPDRQQTGEAPMVTSLQEVGEATPIPECSPLPAEMTIHLSRVLAGEVQIEMTALTPGDTPVVFVYIAAEDLEARLTAYPRDPAGEDGSFVYILKGLSQYLENTGEMSVRVIHSRGVACAELSIP